MLVVKLQGGLGNQMFQYAAARGISKPNENIYLDHQFLEENHTDSEHFTARKYELDIFENIKPDKATPNLVKRFKDSSAYFKIKRALTKHTVIQQHENELIDLSYRAANIYLDGYFQSEKYFIHLRDQLIREFEFPTLDPECEQIRKTIKSTANAVSIHVRRGDYLKSPITYDIHGVLPLSYYERAINALKTKYPDLSLFIFSDDSDWAKTNLKLAPIKTEFIEGNSSANSWKDMALMISCKHHIIANSSFSWWGAWLSQNNGEVYAPANWFNTARVKFNIHDFIPDRWHIIQND